MLYVLSSCCSGRGGQAFEAAEKQDCVRGTKATDAGLGLSQHNNYV